MSWTKKARVGLGRIYDCVTNDQEAAYELYWMTNTKLKKYGIVTYINKDEKELRSFQIAENGRIVRFSGVFAITNFELYEEVDDEQES